MIIAVGLYQGFAALDAMGPYEVLTYLPDAEMVIPHTEWTTSVCTGALLLGAAGLLNGLPATTHWSAYDALASYGAQPTEQRVVTAGRIMTGAGVSAGIDLALTLGREDRRTRSGPVHSACYRIRSSSPIRRRLPVEGAKTDLRHGGCGPRRLMASGRSATTLEVLTVGLGGRG
jgi:hypothetical protein